MARLYIVNGRVVDYDPLPYQLVGAAVLLVLLGTGLALIAILT
jgi:hypothetical protein